MTDFFTSLVDRALDLTPVLERRQPTLFEPSAATAAFDQSNVGRPSPLPETEIVVESGPVSIARNDVIKNASFPPQRTSPRAEPESQPVETPSSRRRRNDDRKRSQIDQAEAQPATTPFTASQETHVEKPRHEATPAVAAKPQEISVTPMKTIETIVERRVEREIVTERSTETPSINEVHSFAQPQVQPRISNHDTAAEQKHPAKAEVIPLAPPKERTAIKPLVEKKAITRKDSTSMPRALSRAESRQPAKQPAMPTIHVTIGRVEVRATPPAAGKSRSPQPVGPKLSLEDYLRSRGEGNK
jgi:hypothetical protein